MAERDPDTIKKEIDVARRQLASTVDMLAERANPQQLADRAKARVIEFVKQPAVALTLAGLGTITVLLVIRRVMTSAPSRKPSP